MNQRIAPPLLVRIFMVGLIFGGALRGGTFEWANTTANWNLGPSWMGSAAPSGTDPSDILNFGGNVATPYTSTNNLAAVPSLINQLVFNAGDTGVTGNSHIINGAAIALGGTNPQIVQSNVGAFTINVPIEMRAPLTLSGNGGPGNVGTVTLNHTVSGVFDITKEGTSTFRFGTPFVAPSVGPSANSWFGRLTINEGTIRFNNNAEAGRTALRGNPIFLNSPTALLTVSSELRTGTLNGASGVVESRVTGGNTDNENIVINALTDGTYAGALRLLPGTGLGNSNGTLVIRGVGTQMLTGTLQIEKDIAVGKSATVSLAGNASLALQASGAMVMNGGTIRLDNSAGNLNRIRDGSPITQTTGLDTVGGGLLTLIGNITGTTELIARLQLGTSGKPRSGALAINVRHSTGATGATEMRLQSLSRDGTTPTFATVDFSANDSSGAELTLGQTGAAPRIIFNTAPLLANGLLGNTAGLNVATVGWATVNGSAFATHGANGIAAVSTVPAPPGGTTAGDPTANVGVTGDFVASFSAGYSVNSLRLEPTAEGQSFEINTANNLKTNAILLAGPRDYTISGTGGLAGVGTIAAAARYIHVESATLTISARVDAASLPLVKAGEGTLVLTNGSNVNLTTPTIINGGTLRATPGSSLPHGELRLRGGVLEITGGGTFARGMGRGPGFVNWSGIDDLNTPIDEDRGSGGFAAVGADVTIDLNATGPSAIAWEDNGFVNSGHALTFGSPTADRRVTWSDNLNLNALTGVTNYNAREIRVTDNPASATDSARVSGAIVGTVQNDLIKTGAGTLELTGANTYQGATIVHQGTLVVNSPGTLGAGLLTEVRNGATLGGNGTVGRVKVAPGGRLAPGSAVTDTGILSTGPLSFDGAPAQLSLQLGGTTAGAGYDQVGVTGTVTLDGADLLGSLINGFAPTENDLFFIIINDGVDPVTGKFVDGDFIFFDNTIFEISYAGDSGTNSLSGGNDVVLHMVPEPSIAGLTAGGLALLFSRRRRA